MVDAVDPISHSISTSPIVGERSLSIASEPDNKWIAERQSQIDADLAARVTRPGAPGDERKQPVADEELPPLFEGHSGKHLPDAEIDEDPKDEEDGEHLLSGESDKIGTVNFDEDTPFGERVAIV